MQPAALERRRRHPLAAALGQNGRLGKLLRGKTLRRARLVADLAAGNGLQIAVIMPTSIVPRSDGRLSFPSKRCGILTYAFEQRGDPASAACER